MFAISTKLGQGFSSTHKLDTPRVFLFIMVFFSLQLSQYTVETGPSDNNVLWKRNKPCVMLPMEHPSRKQVPQRGDFPPCLCTGRGRGVSSARRIHCPCPVAQQEKWGHRCPLVLSRCLLKLSCCNVKYL